LSATVDVELAGRTHRGTVRLINTDHFLVIRLSRRQETLLRAGQGRPAQAFNESGYIMLVADGLGDDGAARSRAVSRSTFATSRFTSATGTSASTPSRPPTSSISTKRRTGA
jgi:serine/threonine protein phosphatase PrpC